MNRWLSGALFLWAATQANASEQLLCRFPSTEDGKLFETPKIDVTVYGSRGRQLERGSTSVLRAHSCRSMLPSVIAGPAGRFMPAGYWKNRLLENPGLQAVNALRLKVLYDAS
jgi:hypothetical protein